MSDHIPCDRHETRLLIQLAKDNPNLRYCRECKEMLPLDRFPPKNKRFFCREHLSKLLKWHKCGKPAQRTAINIRCKGWTDKKVFGQTEFNLTHKDVRKMITQDQIDHCSDWCIVPMIPTQPVSPSNAVVVSSTHRIFLVAHWKKHKNEEEYQRLLQMHLVSPNAPENTKE